MSLWRSSHSVSWLLPSLHVCRLRNAGFDILPNFFTAATQPDEGLATRVSSLWSSLLKKRLLEDRRSLHPPIPVPEIKRMRPLPDRIRPHPHPHDPASPGPGLRRLAKLLPNPLPPCRL